MHTHHTHSGSFCAHADPSSTLELMFQTALNAGMTVFAMTEHMPRDDVDLYPEEIEAGDDEGTLMRRWEGFMGEAVRLRKNYYATGSVITEEEGRTSSSTKEGGEARGRREMEVLIGIETEHIRPSTLTLLRSLLATPHGQNIDYLLGSVHHVHTIPVDFDRATYLRARAACSPPTDAQLAADYFEAQFEMLHALRPQVVGHFDLIRLLADEPDLDWRTREGGEVWSKIERNLRFIKSYDGLLEINTSAWRKGLTDPYPRREVVERWREMGGDVVLSDDSHSVSQIGTNYGRLKGFLGGCGVRRIAFLRRQKGDGARNKQGTEEKEGLVGRCEVGYVDVEESR